MKAPFNGTDTTELEFDAEAVKIIDALLDQCSFSGASLDLGNSLDALFGLDLEPDARARFPVSHDQLALLCEIFTKAAFTRAARPSAARAQAIIVTAHQSFYKEG